MDLKDRSLRRLNSKSLRRDGFKVFSSKPIALNNAEQQKARSNDEPTKSLSPFFCCVVVSLSLLWANKVFVVCGDVSNEKFDFCI